MSTPFGNPKFGVYQLPEDYEELRAAVRAVATDKVAPHAAEADENSEFPQAAWPSPTPTRAKPKGAGERDQCVRRGEVR